MIHGKHKAVTFSYDDGVTQDKRLIELFDRYGLKGTFNLNSDLLGKPGSLIREGVEVSHCKIAPEEVAEIYRNHEVAVHSLTHPTLTQLPDEEVIRQVEEDRRALSRLCGYTVVGMAYPNGPNDERVAGLIREQTGVKYARTVTSTYRFDRQSNLYRFNPTVYHREFDRMTELAEQFLSLEADTDQIFYIWGHAYEFDIDDSWNAFERFCQKISGHDDIFYGTNTQVLLSE